MTVTECQAQTNRQIERCCQTMMARFRGFIDKHQQNWDMFVQRLTYAYNTQVHKTTGTSLFGLMLSRELPKYLSLLKTTPINEKYRNLPRQRVKRKNLDRLHHRIHKPGKKLSKAHYTFNLGFDWRVRYTRQFTVDDMVYVDSLPLRKRSQGWSSTVGHSSAILRPKKSGRYQVVRATPQTVGVDINELHNTVATNQEMLSQAAQKANQGTNESKCDSPFSRDYETKSKKLHTVEPAMQEEANTALKNDSPSPTAKKNVKHAKHHEQNTPIAKTEN